MKAKFADNPVEALRQNGKQVIKIGQTYATAGLAQLGMCRHKNGEPCGDCLSVNDGMHYFAVALAIIGAAAVEGKASGLFELLTGFAVKNLENFPPEINRPLYVRESDFPDFIEEPEATDGA